MEPRARILILNERDPRHPRAGGAEIHVWENFRRLVDHGYGVTVLASSFAGSAEHEVIEGIQVRRLGRVPLYYPRAMWACARAVRRGDVDLVAECLNKLPYYAPAYCGETPVLGVCHHLFGEAAFLQVPLPVAAAVWAAERPIPWLYGRCRFIAISDSSKNDLTARGLPEEATRVIPCGIRPPAARPERPASARRPLVVYVGRLEAYKRVDVLLRAMAGLRERFPDAETVILGRGQAQEGLEALAKELGLEDRTRFPGFVSDAERDALLAEARVCVCPSVKEGWGLTVIEANAVGTPVVATDAPGLRDSVRDGETGFLVPEGDEAGFARRIGQLLSDDALADRMGHAGEAWAKRFDWDHVAGEVEEVVAELLGRAEPRDVQNRART